MAVSNNDFLAQASSDESASESGYDSEAAEVSKSTKQRSSEPHPAKRRKLSHSSASESDGDVIEQPNPPKGHRRVRNQPESEQEHSEDRKGADSTSNADDHRDHGHTKSPPSTAITKDPSTRARNNLPTIHNGPSSPPAPSTSTKPRTKTKTKPLRPGVIYLSSLPPHLRPSALRNLLLQRGFSPITRLFLTPASSSTKSTTTSRKLYTEGWLEFPSHKLAKKCAQTLNATTIGGKKGGYYRDDLWNMRYLRGMGWEELMSGVAGERREEEARRDEERREIRREEKRFVEGVERGRRWEGMEGKRKRKGGEKAGGGVGGDGKEGEGRRTWRQFEVKRSGKGRDKREEGVSEEAREVLGKIF